MDSGQGDDFAWVPNLRQRDFRDLLGNLWEPHVHTVSSDMWNESFESGGSQALVLQQLGLSAWGWSALCPLPCQHPAAHRPVWKASQEPLGWPRLCRVLKDAPPLSFQTYKKLNILTRELGYCCFNLGFQAIPSGMLMESTGKSLRASTAAGHLWYCQGGSFFRCLF